MAYRKYQFTLLLRVVLIFLSLSALAYAVNRLDFNTQLPIALLIVVPLIGITILFLRNLFRFTIRRFTEMDDFFESIKYRDFSRWFNEKSGPQDIRELRVGFNKVNHTFKQINKEKEAQHLYLQKILELVGTGILAYNLESGNVLWINDSFKRILDIPSMKSVGFVANRNPELYQTVFVSRHPKGNIVSIHNDDRKIKIMISSTTFHDEEDTFRLIVIQNIDEPLNQNESESWRKLLSVMTHEIMNSIAPISSLAETIENKVRLHIEDPAANDLEIDDLKLSIESIRSRSDGLMKFAKTYRGLNKITKLNLSQVPIAALLENIGNLLQPSLDRKNIELEFEIEIPDLKIEIDAHLIEQALINLLLNAMEACKEAKAPKIVISVLKDLHGRSIIRVTDNGKGIPQEMIDQVFIPFFTTKKNGSGVGLSLCKQIMIMHKGRIQLKTLEGKGTVISLIF